MSIKFFEIIIFFKLHGFDYVFGWPGAIARCK